MRRRAAVLVLLALATAAAAQEEPRVAREGFATLVGAGARASGMGGAFTAIADDATAASWNPAGLAQLRQPEVSLVYDSIDTDRTSRSLLRYAIDIPPLGVQSITYQTETPNLASSRSSDIGFASATMPLGNSVIEISARRLARFPSSIAERRFTNVTELGGVVRQNQTFERSVITNGGSIDDYAISGARAMKRLMIGASVGWLRGGIAETADLADASPSAAYSSRTTFAHELSGVHADVGILYDLGGGLTAGAVYRSGFSTALRYRSSSRMVNGSTTAESETEGHSRIRWPHGFSLGLAAKLPYRLTLAADYSRTRWSEAGVDRVDLASFATDATGVTRPAVETLHNVGYPYLTPALQHDTGSLRFGAETSLGTGALRWSFRAGWFTEDQIVNGWGSLNQPRHDGYSGGIGLAAGRHLQFDAAYVVTRGTDDYRVEAPLLPDSFATLTTDSRRVIVSAIVRF
jgi:long-subunit fatty acid transport protein